MQERLPSEGVIHILSFGVLGYSYRLTQSTGLKSNKEKMNEIIFLIEDSLVGGFIARALDVSIFTEADDITDLQQKVRDAVDCHFEPSNKPKIILLHFV